MVAVIEHTKYTTTKIQKENGKWESGVFVEFNVEVLL